MKKPGKKKSTAKRVAKAAKRKPARVAASRATGANKPIVKQPQVKQQAAVAHDMFLFTDDAWSLRYFDPNDLHSKEREVFG